MSENSLQLDGERVNFKMPKFCQNALVFNIKLPVLHTAYNVEKNDILSAKIKQKPFEDPFKDPSLVRIWI